MLLRACASSAQRLARAQTHRCGGRRRSAIFHEVVAFAAGARAMATRADPPGPGDRFDVLLYTEWSSKGRYKELFKQRGMPVLEPDEVEDWSRVGFAVVWKPPPGLLAKCPNLRAAMSLGAGVDHLLHQGPQQGQVPPGLPVLRVVDPRMAKRMATWVIWGVISWQRRFEQYFEAQRAARWDLEVEGRSNLDNCDVRVGVLGAGLMGRATAEALAGLGYRVTTWSRTGRQGGGGGGSGSGGSGGSGDGSGSGAGAVRHTHGREALRPLVESSDVLVCLLPLTPETRGVVDAELLSWLPDGAAVINGARGAHVVEADLLAALDAGKVGFALLDVFETEPLPAGSPLWRHPRVRLTPHVASMTTLESAADQIAANFHSIAAGKGPLPANVVDRAAGY